MSINNDGEVKIAFEAATIQKATSLTMVRAIAKALVMEEAIMAPVARFVVSQAQKEVSEAA